jgi:hypothetical protein
MLERSWMAKFTGLASSLLCKNALNPSAQQLSTNRFSKANKRWNPRKRPYGHAKMQ